MPIIWALAYTEYLLDLYPEMELALSVKIDKSQSLTVLEVWNQVKAYIIQYDFPSRGYIESFGVMSELFLGANDINPQLYFAIQFRINFEDDGEEYEYSQMVYCEFDLSDYNELSKCTAQCLDLWNAEYQLENIFAQIEAWDMFQRLKNEVLPIRIYGTGV